MVELIGCRKKNKKKKKPCLTGGRQEKKASRHFLYTFICFMNKVCLSDCTSSAVIKKEAK